MADINRPSFTNLDQTTAIENINNLQTGIKQGMDDFVFYVRSSMLALPGRVANDMFNTLGQYFGEKKPSSSLISSMLSDEINIILQEFTNYKSDKAKMKQKRIEKEKGESVLDDEDKDEE